VGDTPLRHLSPPPLAMGLIAMRDGTKWGFVDGGGAMVIEAKFDEVGQFQRGISWTSADGTWCTIDPRGRKVTILPCRPSAPDTPVFTFVYGLGEIGK
jgi:hypothetical protein